MGSLYASAIATAVLQLKEIPTRPVEFDGAVCLFNLAEGVDEAAIEAALCAYGEITSCTLGSFAPAVVRFTTHAAALAAKEAAPKLLHICDGIDTLYNERSYDGRSGLDMADDEGRGWCAAQTRLRAIFRAPACMRRPCTNTHKRFESLLVLCCCAAGAASSRQ